MMMMNLSETEIMVKMGGKIQIHMEKVRQIKAIQMGNLANHPMLV